MASNLTLIIEKTYNDSWSTRFNAYERIERLLLHDEDQLGKALRTNSQLWDKLIASHIDHITDSHFKVGAACIN
jgi:hypothetical protein